MTYKHKGFNKNVKELLKMKNLSDIARKYKGKTITKVMCAFDFDKINLTKGNVYQVVEYSHDNKVWVIGDDGKETWVYWDDVEVFEVQDDLGNLVEVSYSPRRGEIYVYKKEDGKQIFSITELQKLKVSEETLKDDNKLLKWVLQKFGCVIEDCLAF